MSTKDEAKKEEIISSLVSVRRKILQIVAPIPHQAQDVIFLGTWTIKDLLAHLAGWDHTNLIAIQEIDSGQVPGFYKYHDHDWKSYNTRLVNTYKQDDFSELIKIVEDSHQALLECLRLLPAEDYQKDRGLRMRGYKIIISRLLQVETEDEKEHLDQIKQFLGELHD